MRCRDVSLDFTAASLQWFVHISPAPAGLLCTISFCLLSLIDYAKLMQGVSFSGGRRSLSCAFGSEMRGLVKSLRTTVSDAATVATHTPGASRNYQGRVHEEQW